MTGDKMILEHCMATDSSILMSILSLSQLFLIAVFYPQLWSLHLLKRRKCGTADVQVMQLCVNNIKAEDKYSIIHSCDSIRHGIIMTRTHTETYPSNSNLHAYGGWEEMSAKCCDGVLCEVVSGRKVNEPQQYTHPTFLRLLPCVEDSTFPQLKQNPPCN